MNDASPPRGRERSSSDKKAKKSKRDRSPSSSEASLSSSSSSSSSSDHKKRKKSKSSKKKSKKSKKDKKSKKQRPDPDIMGGPQMSAALAQKLSDRNETLDERKARKEIERNAQMSAKFGYTAEENPFNDPNLNQSFSWKKKKDTGKGAPQPTDGSVASKNSHQQKLVGEIEKVRRRRDERDEEFAELNRLKEEESRLREMAHYDDWQKKEEEFHMAQQHQRFAIRLMEGREKPIDVLAKNVLLFGMSEEEKANRSAVKYKERYNALEELDNLTVELTAPHNFLRDLKLAELKVLLLDMIEYKELEEEIGGAATNDTVSRYWTQLLLLTREEVKWIEGGGEGGAHEQVTADINKMFKGQSSVDLSKMRSQILPKTQADEYWKSVLTQLDVHVARTALSALHDAMLSRQLAKIEARKKYLAANPDQVVEKPAAAAEQASGTAKATKSTDDDAQAGDEEADMGEQDEVDMSSKNYKWSDKHRPRKPRYFNRVKTGWDWNKYNQTHYDIDNPPPKVVQGYKFNVFYPDLIDNSVTPKYFIEPADSPEFCILRFHGGAPYEDIAFKIINKQWAKGKHKGFKSSFDRGVLSLFFSFESHWYRR